MLAQLWPFLWGWVRPSTHPTLSIACIYRLPLWRRMLACLQAISTKSTPGIVCCCFQLSGCLLPPPLVPVISHYIIGRSSQPLFSSLRTGFAFLSFPFASSVLSGRLIAHSISWDLQCSRFFAPENFFAPYQTSIHFITTSIMPFACQQEFAQCKKGKQGGKARPGHTLKRTPVIALMQRRCHIEDGCSCMSAHYSFISQASKCWVLCSSSPASGTSSLSCCFHG